jgi:endonuclease/exonuclease/phosphatase family metal-dependent hydrolase
MPAGKTDDHAPETRLPHFVKIRAVTFNLQNGQLWSEEDPEREVLDFAASIKFLRSLEADLYFLQEVERGHDGGRQEWPPPNFTRLVEEFPFHEHHFCYPPVNADELPFGLGLALLSRFPLHGKSHHILPSGEVRFSFGGRERSPSRRSVLRAVIDSPRGPLHLLNTHLQAYFMIGTSSDEHPSQRNCLAALLRGLGENVLLGGDFNSAPEESLVEQMESLGFRSAQTEQITWKRRPYVVDHLFAGPSLTLESCEVIPTEVSDHHAVRAVYEVTES